MSSDTMASATVTELNKELNKQVNTLRQQLGDLQAAGINQIGGQVQSHPLASLLLAFGLGIVGGQLLRR